MSALLEALGLVGNVLDTPGAALRSLLAGRNPLPGVFDPEQRVSGRQLLEGYGLLGENEEGLDFGDVLGGGVDFLSGVPFFGVPGFSTVSAYRAASGAADDAARAASGLYPRLAALRDLEGRMAGAQGRMGELAYGPGSDLLETVAKRQAANVSVGEPASVYLDDVMAAVPEIPFTRAGTVRKGWSMPEPHAYTPGAQVGGEAAERAAALGLGAGTPEGVSLFPGAVKQGFFETRGGRLFPREGAPSWGLAQDPAGPASLSQVMGNPKEAAFLKMLHRDMAGAGGTPFSHPVDMALDEALPLVREQAGKVAAEIGGLQSNMGPLARLLYRWRAPAPQLSPVSLDDPFWLSQAFDNVNPFAVR